MCWVVDNFSGDYGQWAIMANKHTGTSVNAPWRCSFKKQGWKGKGMLSFHRFVFWFQPGIMFCCEIISCPHFRSSLTSHEWWWWVQVLPSKMLKQIFNKKLESSSISGSTPFSPSPKIGLPSPAIPSAICFIDKEKALTQIRALFCAAEIGCLVFWS